MSKKSEKLLEIILTIINDPRQMISEERLEELVKENKSDKTLYRWKKQLTEEEIFQGYPPLKIIKDGDSVFYALNSAVFKYFVPEHLETPYLLDAYSKLGYLFKNARLNEDLETLKSEVFNHNSKNAELKRKFYYLSKIKSHIPSKKQEDLQTKIVNSLINNRIIGIYYDGKMYPRIYPLCLCQYRDALYLIAYKEDMQESSLRKFRISRMENVIETNSTFTYPAQDKWDPETHFKDTSGLIKGEVITAEIKIYGFSRELILEKDFFNGKLIGQNQEYDHYEIKYTNVQEFLGQLFVYAQDIEILSPDSLQDAFSEKAEKALSKNAKKTKLNIA